MWTSITPPVALSVTPFGGSTPTGDDATIRRKNALFYNSLAGARVGDVFMSLIHTTELNGIAPFDYLVALQRHHEQVALDPSEWLPWTYEATLAELRARASPSR